MDFSHFCHWQDKDQQIIVRKHWWRDFCIWDLFSFHLGEENMTEISGWCDKDQLQKEEDEMEQESKKKL